MITENIYLVCNLFLDPPETDFRKLKSELAVKVKAWNRQPENYAYQLQVAEEFLELSSPPGVYGDRGASLQDQASEARKIREEEGKIKAAAYEEDGILEASELEAHIKEFGLYFNEETIKQWFKLGVGRNDEYVFKVPVEPNYGGASITSPGIMKKIADDLRIITGKTDATLYEFLGVRPQEDRSIIEETAKTALEEAHKSKGKGQDVRVDARIRVLKLANSLFKDDAYQKGYDIALRHRPFYQLRRALFEARALKGSVTLTEYSSSLRELRNTKIPDNEAEWLVYNFYCVERKCPHPKLTNDEEVTRAKLAAEKAKEDARREIEKAKAEANAQITAAKKEAQEKVDTARHEAETKVKAARERADSRVAAAEATVKNAEQKRLTAEKKQREAEEISANALSVARKEFENEKTAATVAKTKAEEEQKVAQAKISEAQTAISQAEISVKKAKQKQQDAEQTAKIEIANAIDAKDKQTAAEKSRWRAIVSAISIVVIAVATSLYCLQSAFTSNLKATEAIAKADQSVAAANKRAEERETAATEKEMAADKKHQKALDEQKVAEDLRSKALDEQKTAKKEQEDARQLIKQNEFLVTKAKEDKETALEKEKKAAETEKRAIELKKEADGLMVKAEQIKQDAEAKVIAMNEKVLKTTQEAERQVNNAKEIARSEVKRRNGVEAMINAGAPLKFPSGNDVQEQENAPQRRSGLTSPLPGYGNLWNGTTRPAKEILSDVVWRWCLEGELGTLDEDTGKLIGEVTGKENKGYIESLQGVGGWHQANVELWERTYNEPYPVGRWTDPAGRWNNPPYEWNVPPISKMTSELRRKAMDINPMGMLANEGTREEKLDRRFLLSQTQVTQELWESVMGNNPSRFIGTNRPVENVSWEDCQIFIAKLNEMKEVLGVPEGYEFTLPKESEWEHACRAGTSTPFHFGLILDGTQANTNGNYPFGTNEKGEYLGETSDVGTYSANAWGLYDMHGNVWEWCQDPYNFAGALAVPSPDGFYRSLRGGSWNVPAQYCRSAYRGSSNPQVQHDDIGLRLCLAAVK